MDLWEIIAVEDFQLINPGGFKLGPRDTQGPQARHSVEMFRDIKLQIFKQINKLYKQD